MTSIAFWTQLDEFPSDFVDSLGKVPVGVYRASVEGKLVCGNHEMARIFGFESVQELADVPMVNLYRSKTDRGALMKVIARKKKVENVRMPFVHKDGSPIWCAITACGVFDDDGELIFVDGILRDITEQMAEEDFFSRREKLQGVLEMAGAVVHHFNQPLTIINNFVSEMLSDSGLSTSQRDKLAKINEQVRKLNEIAKKIGNVKKVEVMEYVAGVNIVDIDKSI